MQLADYKQRFRPVAPEQHISIAEQVCPMSYETSGLSAPDCPQLSAQRIGPISLVRYDSHGVEHGARTLAHIRSNPLDCFILCLPLQAHFHFSHAGLNTDVVPGAAVLLTAQQPFDAYIAGTTAGDGAHSSIQLRIPGALLRSRVPHADQLCNRLFSTSSGAGMILIAALEATLLEGGKLSEVQAARQSQALAYLIANCVEQIEGSDHSPTEVSGGTWVFDRAMAFIECQLSDPELNGRQIAEHCKVSLSYLHKLFARRSLNVAAHIRELRLERCQDALRNLRLSDRSVIDIASRWGFSDPSHFARVYKQRFGVSPRQERQGGGRPVLN